MLDFFDEDFPLTKKQEEMIKAMEEAAKKAAIAEAPKPAGNEPLPMNTSPAADEPAHEEQPMQTYSEAAPKAEAVSEPAATAAPEIAAEPIPETVSESVPEPIAKTVPEIVPEPMAEAVPEAEYEPVAEVAESIAEEASAEYAAKAIAESIPEAAAESEPLAEPTVPVYETEPAVEAISGTVCEAAVPGEVPEPAANKAFEPASEEIAEPAAEDISKNADEKIFETTASDVSETTQDGIPLPEPETAQSPDNDEDAAIKRIFQPSHEESTLPESDNQAFSYEYDSRYYAEEETPAYKYGVSPSARKRTRPARAAEANDGNITVSTKTLLKVGAVVAATAAAVKLLSKKD